MCIRDSNTAPILSWKLSSDVRGVVQKDYRVGVASTAQKAAAGQFDIWDSGLQKSEEQAVTVSAKLTEKTGYYWRVTVSDNKGNQAESEVASFETGFFEDSKWEAKWIELADVKNAAPENYTIDFDFRLIKDNLGFIFAAKDSRNFLMWQINTFEKKFGGSMSFRPHIWTNGSASVISGGEKVLSEELMPKEDYYKQHHMTISVAGNRIVTSVDGTVIDDRTHSAAGYGKIGFRHTTAAGDCDEQGAYDNIVVKDGSGNILFSDNFDSGINSNFDIGTVENGELKVVNATGLQKDSEASAPLYRKSFNVTKKVEKARAYASALGIYELEINGSRVGEDYFNPGWTAYTLNPSPEDNYVMYQTFDVTDYLKNGENVIGAVTGHGWYSGKLFVGGNNRYGTGSKLLCQLEITYTDGSTEIISTDKSWLTNASGPILSDDFQLGETYDARKEIEHWSDAGCDISGWSPASESSYAGRVIAQIGPTVREIARLKPVSIDKRPDGKYIVDFGQNIAGFVCIAAKGNSGDTITLRHGEMLNADGSLYTDNLRSATATDRYTLKGGAKGETYTPRFTFHGFRYAEISGYPGELTEENISAVALSSLQERTGSYETSNEMVNQLQSNIAWGQLDNFISVPTDCPQRDERLGYTGDSQVFVRTAAYNSNVKEFFNKFMLDITSNQRDTGAIADWAPNYVTSGDRMSGSFGNSGWGDAVVTIPWTMYTTYGDKTVITDNYEAMKAWVGYYESKASSGSYIINSSAYGDWLSVNASTPTNLISTGFFAYCSDLLSRMAAVIGEAEDAAYYSELFSKIKADFNKEFVSSDGHVSGNTQTGYLVALKFDLLPTKELREKAAALLVEDIKLHDWHLTTGFIGVSYLNPVLTEMGYGDVAYRLLLQETYPSWLYSVKNGATTIWERWNSYNAETGTFGDVGMNSFNHYSLGSVGEWFYQYSAGIRYDEAQPGYKHTIIKPTIGGGLDYVNASFESEYGTIESNWRYEDSDVLVMEISVPAGTTATVYVPAKTADGITESGVSAAEAEAVEFTRYADGAAVYEIGSGDYVFRSKIDRKVTLKIDDADSSAPVKISVNGGDLTALPYIGEFAVGDDVTVTAYPANDADCSFTYWSGDILSNKETLTVTMDDSKELTAHCRDKGYKSLAQGKQVSVSSNHNSPPTWSKDNLTDGNTTSAGGYSSGTFSSTDQSVSPVWVEIDLGADTDFDRLHLYARRNSVTSSGLAASFPKDYKIEVREDGKTVYKTICEKSGDTLGANGTRVIESETPVTARYIRLSVSRLGDLPTDDSYYRLQLAEIGIYNTKDAGISPSTDYLKALTDYAKSLDSADEALSAAIAAADAVLAKTAAEVAEIESAENMLEDALAKLGDPDDSVLLGDLDDNGVVNVADIVMLKALIMNGKWSPENLKVGDIDKNGSLNVSDMLSVKNIIMSA